MTEAPPESEGTEEEGTEEEQHEEETPDVAELHAEIARLKQEAAANRIKARDANKKLKQVATTSSGSENNLAAAEERGREAARLEYGVKLARAEVKAALSGIAPDEQITDIIEDLNLARYVGEDGDVDDDAVKVLKARYTALLGKKPPAKVSHGRQGSTSTPANNDEREVVQSLFGG